MPPFRHKRLPGLPSDLNTGKRIGLRNRLFKLVQTIAPSVPFPVLQSEGEPGTLGKVNMGINLVLVQLATAEAMQPTRTQQTGNWTSRVCN